MSTVKVNSVCVTSEVLGVSSNSGGVPVPPPLSSPSSPSSVESQVAFSGSNATIPVAGIVEKLTLRN